MDDFDEEIGYATLAKLMSPNQHQPVIIDRRRRDARHLRTTNAIADPGRQEAITWPVGLQVP